MADLSGYTPIYIRTTGNDTTGDGSFGSPYATAQKGFDIAVATPSGNYVLDFGAGSFGGVVTGPNGWPARIAVRGVGATQSNIGGINGNAVSRIDEEDPEIGGWVTVQYPAEAGDIEIASDASVNLGAVSSDGAFADNVSSPPFAEMQAGNVTLTDCVASAVSANGGSNDTYDAYSNGGAVTLTGCVISGGISTRGGDAWLSGGGSGGAVSLTGCTVGGPITPHGGGALTTGGGGGSVTAFGCVLSAISTHGGTPGGPTADYAGGSGNVTLTETTCGNINTYGFPGFWAASGGAVSITDSVAGDINASGGEANNDYSGGGGSVTAIRSQCGSISTNGAPVTSNISATSVGSGGAVSITDSVVGAISAVGGYLENGYGHTGYAASGAVTLTGSSPLPDSISGGSLNTAGLSKGRGVNGSSILGLT